MSLGEIFEGTGEAIMRRKPPRAMSHSKAAALQTPSAPAAGSLCSHPAGPWTCQAGSYLRAFTPAVTTAWDTS